MSAEVNYAMPNALETKRLCKIIFPAIKAIAYRKSAHRLSYRSIFIPMHVTQLGHGWASKQFSKPNIQLNIGLHYSSRRSPGMSEGEISFFTLTVKIIGKQAMN